MNKKVSVGAALAVAALAVALTFVITVNVMTTRFNNQLKGVQSQKNQYEKLSEISAIINENAYYGVTDDLRDVMLAEAYAQALRDSGDKYARYYTREEREAVSREDNGTGSGIGIKVLEDEDGVYVFRILRGSPAQAAGILAGDVITAIYDENGSLLAQGGDGYTAMYAALRQELGTTLEFNIIRTVKTVTQPEETTDETVTPDGETEPSPVPTVTETEEEIRISVTLAEYANESVWVDYEDGVAVITVTEFNYDTDEAFISIIDSIERNTEVTGVIFDLRNNGGGQLSTVVNMLDRLLPEGVIVTETNADGKEIARYMSDEVSFNKKMAVLVNGSTASAAELFSCALRDYGKAQLVGSDTYGKGCIQTTYALSDGGAIVLTTAMYNPPSSGNYDGKPLEPDVYVALTDEQRRALYSLSREDDPQYLAALPLVTVQQTNAESNE